MGRRSEERESVSRGTQRVPGIVLVPFGTGRDGQVPGFEHAALKLMHGSQVKGWASLGAPRGMRPGATHTQDSVP